MLSMSSTGRYQHHPMQLKEQSLVQTPPATIRISVHNSSEQHKSCERERLVCFAEVDFILPSPRRHQDELLRRSQPGARLLQGPPAER